MDLLLSLFLFIIPSSMFTCVMGLPAAGYIGFASMSIVDFEAAAEVLSALGAATGALLRPLFDPAFFPSAAESAASPAVDLWGIFRMSLYFDCLYFAYRPCQLLLKKRRRDKGASYVGGAAVVPSLRSVIMSISWIRITPKRLAFNLTFERKGVHVGIIG